MKTETVVIARIYTSESRHLVAKITDYLTKEAKIHGLSVFRAVTGFGDKGEHTTSFIDLSLDLPLVIEFFDSKSKMDIALEHFNTVIKPRHMIFWEAQCNLG